MNTKQLFTMVLLISGLSVCRADTVDEALADAREEGTVRFVVEICFKDEPAKLKALRKLTDEYLQTLSAVSGAPLRDLHVAMNEERDRSQRTISDLNKLCGQFKNEVAIQLMERKRLLTTGAVNGKADENE